MYNYTSSILCMCTVYDSMIYRQGSNALCVCLSDLLVFECLSLLIVLFVIHIHNICTEVVGSNLSSFFLEKEKVGCLRCCCVVLLFNYLSNLF